MKEEDFINSLLEDINEFMKENGVTESGEKAHLIRKLFDAIAEDLQKQSSEEFEFIEAPNVVMEIIDQKTGVLFRRYLEMEYIENNNGLKVTGETLEGRKTHIAFLSDNAINRLHELKGSGWDEPRCK